MNSGDKILTENANWSFKGSVVKKFDGHISKSVPLYETTHELYLNLSDFFLMDKSKIIDIGCSTGTFLNKIYLRHDKNKIDKKIYYQGYDNVKEMISFAKKKNKLNRINFYNKDIEKINFSNSAIISSFYTIQFINPKKRQLIIKVLGCPDARFQDYLTHIYNDYKLAQGYSKEEIFSKSMSLKGILEPFSTKGNTDMLKRAGFKDIIIIFKYGCFEGYLAIK